VKGVSSREGDGYHTGPTDAPPRRAARLPLVFPTMSSWHRNEYILKGVFLGLWTFVALQVAVDRNAVRVDLPWVLGWVAAGLLVGLLAGVALQLRRGVKPWQNWGAFPLLVLLESPTFIYCGVVLGLAAGVLSGREFSEPWAGPIA